MALRPWIVPFEVKEYSEKACVKNRDDIKLLSDIGRAEQYVIAYTRNNFCDYPAVPEPVRTALLLLAEMYAESAASSVTGELKSETFDDYAYTAHTAPTDNDARVKRLGLSPLLDPFTARDTGGVEVKLRKV